MQEYTSQRAEEITWVPKEQIIETTWLFAKTNPSCLHSRLGAGAKQINATQTVRAICILMALAGDFDVPEGNLLGDKLGGFKTTDVIAQILRTPAGVDGRKNNAKSS